MITRTSNIFSWRDYHRTVKYKGCWMVCSRVCLSWKNLPFFYPFFILKFFELSINSLFSSVLVPMMPPFENNLVTWPFTPVNGGNYNAQYEESTISCQTTAHPVIAKTNRLSQECLLWGHTLKNLKIWSDLYDYFLMATTEVKTVSGAHLYFLNKSVEHEIKI